MFYKKPIIIKGGIFLGLFLLAIVFGFAEESTTSNVASVFSDNDTPNLTDTEPQLEVTRSGDNGDTNGDKKVSPSLSPVVSPNITVSPTPVLSPILKPTPTPTPIPSPSPIPTPPSTPSPIPSLTPSPTPEPEDDTSSVTVVVNEIAWMGTSASTNDEWIELHNITGQTIDLTGWTLRSTDGTPNITLSGTIGPFGFYLLERTSDQTISDISADQIYTGALGNGGEGLELSDNAGDLKDSADFATGWPAGDNTTKSSMERIDPNQSGSAANWSTNNGITKNGQDTENNPINGTPKAKNS